MRGELSLFDTSGERKYLCAKEVPRFLKAAARADAQTDALCRLLVYTGCRISEALQLTARRLDPETGRVVFRTLKRRQTTFRAVPIPADLMQALRRFASKGPKDAALWPWSRQTAWRRVKRVMESAGIAGAHAMPKGLRHGFGVANAEGGVPMGTTQKWLGHAYLETTAIYQQAVGREEAALARRAWRAWR
jgi:integrase/recombinase XerD